MKNITLLLLLTLGYFISFTQPVNDACPNAILISSVSNYCSANAGGTSIGATDDVATSGGFGVATCWGGTVNDVWYKFVAIATDISIIIDGNQGTPVGGTIVRPQVALYSGTCSGTLTELVCGSPPAGQNIIQVYRAGLTIGETYLIRVDGNNANTGTFKYCINNYNPVPVPSSDCPTAVSLCSKDPFTVPSVSGAGLNNTEMNDAACFGGGTVETNSTWYVFKFSTSGTFNFVMVPSNPGDDLDFVVYKLPNGIGNCTGKTVQRCMASAPNCTPGGGNANTSSTGLTPGALYNNEYSGCNTDLAYSFCGIGSSRCQSQFAKELTVVAGETYAIAINNFTSTGNGFSISFGGTAQIQGPVSSINDNDADDIVCIGQPITYTDASSPPPSGTITSWIWNFGANATPSTSVLQNPPAVTYSTTGVKTVSLTVKSNQGCLITSTKNITVNGQAPAVTVIVSQNNICPNTPVIFTAIPTNGGTTPTYQWYLNNSSIAGATNSTYTTLTLSNNDQIKVKLTSNLPCSSPASIMSNVITMVITAAPSVDVTITGNTPVCQSTSLTLTANPTNGGTTPVYQWYLNGNPVGTNSSTYSNTGFINGDTVTVKLTSSLTCVSNNPKTSSPVSITIKTNPSVNVTSPVICSGLTAQPIASGATSYTWTGGLTAVFNPTTPVLTTTTTYTVTGTTNGCTGTAISTVTVKAKTTSTINQTICQGQSVTIGGQTFTTTQTNKIIVLANANSNGCDSTITLSLTVNPKTTSVVNQTICQGQSVTVGGQIFTTTQTNKIIVLANANSNGCDSTITLNLTVNPKTTSTINQTICLGQSITVGGQIFSTTQTNKIIVLSNGNSNGCDSIITLNLTVSSSINSNVTLSICQGSSVIVGGQVFSTPQINKTITLPNGSIQGCDSVITLNLNITSATSSTINQTICQGQSTTVGGQTFTTTQTNKIIVLANANSNGCDSTITFNLIVNPKTNSSITQTICQGQSITVGGQTFTTTQTNKIILLTNANSNGCDSTITLNLTVNSKTTSTINKSICQGQSITVGGQTFTTAQTNKIIVLANANSNGCDSTITFNLMVNPKTNSSITQTICQGQSITVGGQTFTTPQINKTIVLPNGNSNGCDSTITLNLTVNTASLSAVTRLICQGQSIIIGGQTFTTPQVNKTIVLPNGSSNGCDSIITLNLTVNSKTTSNVNQIICSGQSITVGGQIFNTPQANKIIVLPNANSNGCDSTITLNLTVKPNLTYSINKSICQGQNITIGGQTFNTPQTNKIIVLPNAGSNGCDSIITFNLVVDNPAIPVVSITSNKTNICSGDVVTFNAITTNTGNPTSFQWYVNSVPSGTNGNQFTSSVLNNNDEIKVVITTTTGCLGLTTATSNSIVIVKNAINYSKPQVVYCKNDSFLIDNLNMQISVVPDPKFTIVWKNGANVTTDSTINYTVNNVASGNIPFTIKYGNNCSVNDVLNFTVKSLPVINAVVDLPKAKYEQEVQLDVATTQSLNYNWIPAGQVNIDSIKNPTSVITSSILFIVFAEDKNSKCIKADSVFVELINECQNDYLFVPDGFSPNRDGINDCFAIVSPPRLSDFKMTIFNRWGEKVFETNDKDVCWDGTFKGADAMIDSYPYLISFKCYNGTHLSKKGLVSVIR